MSTRETVKAFMEMTGEAQKRPAWADKLFVQTKPNPSDCEHEFQGWRQFADGNGGERVCAKCGIGAQAYTLSLDF